MIPFSLLVKVVVCPVAGAAFTGSTRRCAPPRTMPAAYQMSGGRRTGATANPCDSRGGSPPSAGRARPASSELADLGLTPCQTSGHGEPRRFGRETVSILATGIVSRCVADRPTAGSLDPLPALGRRHFGNAARCRRRHRLPGLSGPACPPGQLAPAQPESASQKKQIESVLISKKVFELRIPLTESNRRPSPYHGSLRSCAVAGQTP
jgi:hypothetical protein